MATGFESRQRAMAEQAHTPIEALDPVAFLRVVMSGLHSLCSQNRGRPFSAVGFYEDPDELFTAALRESHHGRNVWFGVHPLVERPEGGRGAADDILSVGCLVADLDWLSDAHADQTLPMERDVRTMLDGFTPAPSIIVETGHGVQAYWMLTSAVSAVAGEKLTTRLHTALAAAGLKPERRDLASVLRVPGTQNVKTDEHLPVWVSFAAPQHRYTKSHLDDVLPAIVAAVANEARQERRPHGLPTPATGDRPGDRWADTITWRELLENDGWAYVRTIDDVDYFARPGKDPRDGISATVGYKGSNVLKMFSGSHPQLRQDETYTKFGYLTAVRFGGDHAAAARWCKERLDGTTRESNIGGGNSTSDVALPADPVPVAPDGYPVSDIGNADRLIALAGGRLRFVHAWSKWIAYDRGRWVMDVGDVLVTETAKQISRSLYAQIVKCGDPDLEKAVFALARRSTSAASIAAAIKLARGIPGVLVAHEELDANPNLLNVANGTIDLRTGELRPHDPADLMTMQAPTFYDPFATAPLWAQCLERWQPDPSYREYLQREAGAGATGHATETLSVHFGSGGNGKSKFWGAVTHTLGEYVVEPDKSLLVNQKYEPHATVVASLFRKRLGVASETSSAATLNDEMIKRLTGGDRLRARRMREDEWSFEPTHTLIMFSNHRPAVAGRDEGVWRRLRLVPWEVSINEGERDINLSRKLAAEAPGILNWIVEGARQFLAEGFTLPAGVRDATERYRQEEDVVTKFADEVLRIGDGWMRASDLRQELSRWAEDTGCIAPPLKDVTEWLRGRGCRSERRRIAGQHTTVWLGVSLLGVYDDTPAEQDF